MEYVHTTEGKITATTKHSTMKITTSKLPTPIIAMELVNLDSMYTSYKLLILTVTQLLKREPSFNGMSPFNKCTKRSLLPF